MSLSYIRSQYLVPAVPHGRVRYLGDKTKGPQFGTIIGASGAHIDIRMDNTRHAQPYHPTWELEYLSEAGDVIWPRHVT